MATDRKGVSGETATSVVCLGNDQGVLYSFKPVCKHVNNNYWHVNTCINHVFNHIFSILCLFVFSHLVLGIFEIFSHLVHCVTRFKFEMLQILIEDPCYFLRPRIEEIDVAISPRTREYWSLK